MIGYCKGGARACPIDEAEGIKDKVEAALSCRAFVFDVLMDGMDSGCSKTVIKELKDFYGHDALQKAFEES